MKTSQATLISFNKFRSRQQRLGVFNLYQRTEDEPLSDLPACRPSARLSNLRDLSVQDLGVTQDGALSKASVMVSPSGLKGGFVVYKVIHEILKQNQGTSSELL